MDQIQQHMKSFQRAFQKMQKSRLQLINKTIYNHDTIICRFKYLDNPINLKIGNHLIFEIEMKTWEYPEGETVRRKYTPISPCANIEYLDFLFKIYREKSHPSYPHGGKVTQRLEMMRVGDVVDVEGPIGKLTYQNGVVKIEEREPLKVNKIVMIAGGSGISPIYSLISEIINNKDDHTELTLLFANKTSKDILLREQLEKFQPRLKLHFIIDNPEPQWNQFVGYVNKDIIQQITGLEKSNQGVLFCSCGPKPLNEIVKRVVQEMKGNYFKF